MTVSNAVKRAQEEARAAAEAEGIYEPTAEQKRLLAERRRLVERENSAKKRRQEIEDAIERDMRENGKRALAVDGKNVALIVPKTKGVTIVNEPALTRLYPELVAAYEQYVEILPKFSTEVREPNGDRVDFR